jgi:hypothetical protein
MVFIAVLVKLGGGPQCGAQAAIDAGYTADSQEAERIARILLKSPKIVNALRAALWYTLHTSLQRTCDALLRQYCAGAPLPRQRGQQ